ncbi:DUF397 domain-containing protein [Actinomadura atramentaria]|uniref:DUF397 domain-containing protein n=1 Tax=Actinomadura atramentaria TaxID=1990 RepID=UPI0003A1F09D|nr:DUF397 domain-containing protein [Actinomadura atramentaria]
MTQRQDSPSTYGWRKSTRSNDGGNCVELRNTRPSVDVRDSKDPDGPVVTVPRAAWSALHTKIQSGALNL